MKRYIALISLVLLAVSSSAFAAATKIDSGSVTTNPDGPTIVGSAGTVASDTNAITIGRLSKGVRIGVSYDKTSYALITKHSNGNNQYGTAADSTAIYFKVVGVGDLTAFPSESTAKDFKDAANNWTAM